MSDDTVTQIAFAQAAKDKRRMDKCLAVAALIDPAAGDFFRRCMVRACLEGMKYVDNEKPPEAQP
jgi:hypothetical protein